MAHEYGKETLSKEDEQIWLPTRLVDFLPFLTEGDSCHPSDSLPRPF